MTGLEDVGQLVRKGRKKTLMKYIIPILVGVGVGGSLSIPGTQLGWHNNAIHNSNFGGEVRGVPFQYLRDGGKT